MATVTYSQVSNLMSNAQKAKYTKYAKIKNLNSLRVFINEIVKSCNEHGGQLNDANAIMTAAINHLDEL